MANIQHPAETDRNQSDHRRRDKLAISDAPMFQRVMSDADICAKVVETILGVKLDRISYHNTEQAIEPGLGKRGVRFDAYLKGSSSVYDIEMQSYPRHQIGRRMRYYQAAMDTDLLGKGENYDKLPESYIIFICTNDPCDLGLPRYDLERTCSQNADARFECGAHWVILNSKAHGKTEDGGLRNLLQYVDSGIVASDALVERIDKAVAKANEDRRWVKDVFCGISEAEDLKIQARIMKEEALKEGLAEGRERGLAEGRERGLAEGRAEGRERGLVEGRERGIAEGLAEGKAEEQARYGKLVSTLLAAGRIDDLQAAAENTDMLEKLYRELGI